MAALAAVLTLAAVLFVGSALLARWQGRVVARVVQRILLDLRERLARKISRMPLAELDRTRAVTCSAGSPTTSTTCSSRCSWPSASSS